MIKISVCIATYNGEKYINKQLSSILTQLGSKDEVIIVDDCSKDNTVNKIRLFNDPRIIIYHNEINQGHVFSFGRAISLAKNDIIFMSDQDDVWIEGRIKIFLKAFEENHALLISSNISFIDAQGKTLFLEHHGVNTRDSTKNFKNILDIFRGKTNYYGCAMAFKKELVKTILPIPLYVESHDLWIAKAAILLRSNSHSDEITLKRRIHGHNISMKDRKLILKLKSRYIFIKSILNLVFRIYINKS